MPRVSVIMPLYNSATYLHEAIESILNQTYRDFELIVVSEPDSSDGSLEIVDSYAAKDSRLKHVINEERLGHCASRNLGIKMASGEFWAIMDADDVSGLRRLEIQILYMEAYPEIGAFGVKHGILGAKGWLIDRLCSPEVLKCWALITAPLRHPTIMVRKEWTERYDLYYDESLPGVEDDELQLRMSMCFPISNINEPDMFFYRRHGANLSAIAFDRDLALRKSFKTDFIKRHLNLALSLDDISLLLFDSGVKAYRGKKQVQRLQDNDALFHRICDANLDVSIYDPDALIYAFKHYWKKQMLLIAQMYKGESKVPRALMDVYKQSSFFSP